MAMAVVLGEVDVRLEQAARTLGAGPFDTFFAVTLPLARRGVIAHTVSSYGLHKEYHTPADEIGKIDLPDPKSRSPAQINRGRPQ